jgi:antitoxin PrlF
MPIRTVTQQLLDELPDEVKERLHVRVGDKVEYVLQDDGRIVLRPASVSAASAFGMFHQPGMPAATVEEMDEAIERFHAEEEERIRKGWA